MPHHLPWVFPGLGFISLGWQRAPECGVRDWASSVGCPCWHWLTQAPWPAAVSTSLTARQSPCGTGDSCILRQPWHEASCWSFRTVCSPHPSTRSLRASGAWRLSETLRWLHGWGTALSAPAAAKPAGPQGNRGFGTPLTPGPFLDRGYGPSALRLSHHSLTLAHEKCGKKRGGQITESLPACSPHLSPASARRMPSALRGLGTVSLSSHFCMAVWVPIGILQLLEKPSDQESKRQKSFLKFSAITTFP